MTARVSVVIPADAGTSHVAGLVERLRRQTYTDRETLVVLGPAIPPEQADRVPPLFDPGPVRWIAARAATPGALRNEAIEAATGDVLVFLQDGDVLDSRYLELVCERLAARPVLEFATACVRASADGIATVETPALTLEGVLGGHDPIPRPTAFRRSVWKDASGFDEALPSCEWHELWIRLLARGARGVVIDEALLGRETSRHSAYRRDLEADRHAAGFRAVLEKHLDLFRANVVAALCDPEEMIQRTAPDYRRHLQRRDELVADVTELRSEASAAEARIRELDEVPIRWGELRRLYPVSPDWGYERGTPIDRYYIERFLESYAGDVRGTVLEVQEADYTRRFGGDRVVESDVVDIDAGNARANVTGDLRRLESVPSDRYDCFILTQTVHVIDDMRASLAEAFRILKPGGVLLVTLPSASRVCLEYGADGDFWRVTEAGARRLFADLFPASHVTIETFGSVLTNVAFMEGLAVHEISAEEFESHDPYHPALVGVRAVKPGGAPATLSRRRSDGRALVLLYHRVAEPALDVHGLAVSPAEFREQMEHLAKDWRPMPLIQLAMASREGWLPDRAVAITFDDGYFDNLELASPILLELGLPATFFLTSHGIQGHSAFWWDVLANVFFGGAPIPPRLEVDWGGELLALDTSSETARGSAHGELYRRILAASQADTGRWMAELVDWAGVPIPDLGRAMTRPEIEELARRPGHSIGGHGVNHLALTMQPRETVRREVADNRTHLEIATGRIVSTFAYPYGAHDDRAVEIAGEVGYRAAVTCVEDAVRAGCDPLRLPRLEVKSADVGSFAERLDGAHASAAARS